MVHALVEYKNKQKGNFDYHIYHNDNFFNPSKTSLNLSINPIITKCY